MNAIDLLKEKVAYNAWANQQMIVWLREQRGDIYEKEVVSSFTSINKLMHHIMEAEKYYFSILIKKEESYEEEISTEKIFEELQEIDKALLAWLSQKEARAIEEVISLKRSPFVETYTVATLLSHVLNHSTYHRGQLLALRPQLGLSEAPKIDYYRYFIDLAQRS